jgi:hypothetical protein
MSKTIYRSYISRGATASGKLHEASQNLRQHLNNVALSAIVDPSKTFQKIPKNPNANTLTIASKLVKTLN